MSAHVVTFRQLYDALVAWGIPASSIRLRDATYVLPDLDYIIKGEFWRWYHEQLFAQGLAKWAPDWDCDDFAWDFAHEAQKSHKRRQRESGVFLAEGIAVLYVALELHQRGIDGAHGFILVAQMVNGAIVLRAVEPQPEALYREYEPTAAEKASCSLVA